MINLLDFLFQWPVITFSMISVVLYLYLNRNLNYWKEKGICGPKPIALLGTMYSYFIKPQTEVELEWYQKYGKIYGLYTGNTPALTVAEPELVKQIMVKDFHTFRNRREVTTTHDVLTKSLTFAVDDDWKRIRAIVSPTFSSGKLKKMYSLVTQCNEEFMQSLDDYANNGLEIDLKRVHGAYSLDVIAKCAFGTNTNSHNDPENDFSQNAINVFSFKTWKLLLLFLMPSFLSKSPKIQNVLASNKSLEFFIEVVKHLVNERKLSRNSNVKHKDFLQLLIDAEKTDETMDNETDDIMTSNHINKIENNINDLKVDHINIKNKKLTENEILAQCLVFLLAGYETTSTTLSFCSYELALNPEIQHKLYKELKTAFDSNGNIEYDTLLKLPYLDAVISETLRKYPPSVRLIRKAMNDIVLGNTGITVPKGMMTEIPVYGIHHDPENYQNPSQFIPERFMPENRTKIKPYTYLPFGTGPRICVGMRFALLEAKLALANVANRFLFYKTVNTSNLLEYRKGRQILTTEKSLIIGIKRR